MKNINQIQLDAEQVVVKNKFVDTGYDLFDFEHGKSTYLNTVFEFFEQVGPTYTDITNTVAEELSEKYVFCEENKNKTHSDVWFTDASFWPYKDDSSSNLLHNITYAYTDSNTGGYLDGSLGKLVKKGSKDNHVEHMVAFKHPKTSCVHVMGSSDTTPEIHNKIIHQIFQPEIEVIIEYNTHLFKIRVDAKTISNPYRNTPHNLTDVLDEHITDIEFKSDIGEDEWVSCDIPVQGPLLPILD